MFGKKLVNNEVKNHAHCENCGNMIEIVPFDYVHFVLNKICEDCIREAGINYYKNKLKKR